MADLVSEFYILLHSSYFGFFISCGSGEKGWSNIHHTSLDFVLQAKFFKLSFHVLQDMHSMHTFYHAAVLAMFLYVFPIRNLSSVGNKLLSLVVPD